jgi:hypothetical protein
VFDVYLTLAPSIVTRTTEHTVLRQRMIYDRFEYPSSATAEDVRIIELTNDTAVTFNGQTFYASLMANTVTGFAGLTINHIQIDAMAQKWYITTQEGLFIANFDGQNKVLIDQDATGGLYVDIIRNCLYWASNSGLKAMPLIKSKNNQFATNPELYNSISDIDRIVVNNNYR